MRTCAAQELWDANEQRLFAAMRQIDNDWKVREYDPALRTARDVAIRQLLASRAKGAKEFLRNAKTMGCRNLTILPFAL